MPERIGPAPNRPERAKSRLIQYVQEFEIRVDCFRAFDMKNRHQHAVLQTLLNIIDITTDVNAALRLSLDTQEKRHHAEYSLLRRHQFNRRRQQGVTTDALRRCFVIGATYSISRRDEDREQPSSESSLLRHR